MGGGGNEVDLVLITVKVLWGSEFNDDHINGAVGDKG